MSFKSPYNIYNQPNPYRRSSVTQAGGANQPNPYRRSSVTRAGGATNKMRDRLTKQNIGTTSPEEDGTLSGIYSYINGHDSVTENVVPTQQKDNTRTQNKAASTKNNVDTMDDIITTSNDVNITGDDVILRDIVDDGSGTISRGVDDIVLRNTTSVKFKDSMNIRSISRRQTLRKTKSNKSSVESDLELCPKKWFTVDSSSHNSGHVCGRWTWKLCFLCFCVPICYPCYLTRTYSKRQQRKAAGLVKECPIFTSVENLEEQSKLKCSMTGLQSLMFSKEDWKWNSCDDENLVEVNVMFLRSNTSNGLLKQLIVANVLNTGAVEEKHEHRPSGGLSALKSILECPHEENDEQMSSIHDENDERVPPPASPVQLRSQNILPTATQDLNKKQDPEKTTSVIKSRGTQSFEETSANALRLLPSKSKTSLASRRSRLSDLFYSIQSGLNQTSQLTLVSTSEKFHSFTSMEDDITPVNSPTVCRKRTFSSDFFTSAKKIFGSRLSAPPKIPTDSSSKPVSSTLNTSPTQMISSDQKDTPTQEKLSHLEALQDSDTARTSKQTNNSYLTSLSKQAVNSQLLSLSSKAQNSDLSEPSSQIKNALIQTKNSDLTADLSIEANVKTKAELSTNADLSIKADLSTKEELSNKTELPTKADLSTKAELSTKEGMSKKPESFTKSDLSTKTDLSSATIKITRSSLSSTTPSTTNTMRKMSMKKFNSISSSSDDSKTQLIGKECSQKLLAFYSEISQRASAKAHKNDDFEEDTRSSQSDPCEMKSLGWKTECIEGIKIKLNVSREPNEVNWFKSQHIPQLRMVVFAWRNKEELREILDCQDGVMSYISKFWSGFILLLLVEVLPEKSTQDELRSLDILNGVVKEDQNTPHPCADLFQKAKAVFGNCHRIVIQESDLAAGNLSFVLESMARFYSHSKLINCARFGGAEDASLRNTGWTCPGMCGLRTMGQPTDVRRKVRMGFFKAVRKAISVKRMSSFISQMSFDNRDSNDTKNDNRVSSVDTKAENEPDESNDKNQVIEWKMANAIEIAKDSLPSNDNHQFKDIKIANASQISNDVEAGDKSELPDDNELINNVNDFEDSNENQVVNDANVESSTELSNDNNRLSKVNEVANQLELWIKNIK